jgi:hypothetical protein
LRYWILSPQSIALAHDVIFERRFFSEKSIRASDIQEIKINRRLLDFGRGWRQQDFIDIVSKNGVMISIEYSSKRNPDIYKILLGWHEKHRADLSV